MKNNNKIMNKTFKKLGITRDAIDGGAFIDSKNNNTEYGDLGINTPKNVRRDLDKIQDERENMGLATPSQPDNTKYFDKARKQLNKAPKNSYVFTPNFTNINSVKRIAKGKQPTPNEVKHNLQETLLKVSKSLHSINKQATKIMDNTQSKRSSFNISGNYLGKKLGQLQDKENTYSSNAGDFHIKAVNDILKEHDIIHFRDTPISITNKIASHAHNFAQKQSKFFSKRLHQVNHVTFSAPILKSLDIKSPATSDVSHNHNTNIHKINKLNPNKHNIKESYKRNQNMIRNISRGPQI